MLSDVQWTALPALLPPAPGESWGGHLGTAWAVGTQAHWECRFLGAWGLLEALGRGQVCTHAHGGCLTPVFLSLPHS